MNERNQTHNQVTHSAIHRISFIHLLKMIRPVIPLLQLHETIRHYTIAEIPLNKFLSLLCSFMKSHSPHYVIPRNSLQFQNNISYQWHCRLHSIAYAMWIDVTNSFVSNRLEVEARYSEEKTPGGEISKLFGRLVAHKSLCEWVLICGFVSLSRILISTKTIL